MRNPWSAVSLFLLLTAPFPSAAQAPEKTPAAKPDYSQEAALVEQSLIKIKFENDGTSTEENTVVVRVQSEAGVQSLGLLTFSYASAVGSFEIEYVRVRKPDGSVIITPPDSVQDMPSEITRQAPFYSDLREKHAAVKGLSIGDVLEYKTVTHNTKPLAPGQFWMDFNFGKESIVLHDEIEVSVPRDRAIKWKSPNTQPVIADAGAYRVYTWTSSHLVHEAKNEQVDNAKARYEQARGRFPAPDVQLTSFQSWDELAHWYRDLQSGRVTPTPEIAAKAAELTKGAADDDAKLRAIYSYVSLQFRYIGVAFGVGRFQPHAAAEVLANQYGDCKDKHTLLAALLGATGIKAYPALISTVRELDPEIPTPSQFNHMITAIPRGNDLLWLDTTSEVGPFQYLIGPLRDKHALVIWDDKPAAIALTPTGTPFPARQDFRMDGKLDEAGTFTGSVEFSTRGDLELLLRSAFRSTAMPQWKDLAQGISQSLGFAGEVSDVTASSPEKTGEPFTITYKYHRKDYGDWPNRRIVAPAPFVSLPAMTPEMSSLTTPFLLGQPIQVTSHSKLELPKGYTIELPSAIHLKREFAAFDATYTFKDGEFVADRDLHTLVIELLKSDFSDYEKFSKTVFNDYNSFIQLAAKPAPANEINLGQLYGAIPAPAPSASASAAPSPGFVTMMSPMPDLPDSSNEEALRLEAEASEALLHNDPQTAIASLYRAVSADPKFLRAWLTLGRFLLFMHQTDAALDAFQKAIAADPKEPVTYQTYAMSLNMAGKFAEAVPVWQSYIKLAPDDPTGPASLGVSLTQLKRYGEAANAYESAVKLAPDSATYQLELAGSYLHSGSDAKAEETYRKFLALTPQPDALNYAAYEMTLGPKTLPIALEMAQQSVRAAEEISQEMEIENVTFDDEQQALKLSYSWATLGVVQQRLGKLDDAEKTLTASWKLTQNGVAAAHLCELYMDQHKTAAALSMCRLARNRLPLESQPIPYRVPELIAQNDARLEKLSPGSSKTYNMNTIDQIADMRDYKLPRVSSSNATAEFFVLAKFDPQAGKFKVLGVKYVSGSEKLKPVPKALMNLNFNFTSPDGNPVRVLRRGTFLCGGESACEFMLPDANSGHSVPIPMKVIH